MILADPYAVPGRYLKAQLHAHTNRSDGRLAPDAVADLYRNRGYAFLVITDHDRVTPVEGLNGGGLLVLPGVEETVPRPTRLIGPHLGVLLVERPGRGSAQERIAAASSAGGVVAINHPSWPSVLGIGGWPLSRMTRLSGYSLVEVRNPHSDPDADTARWAAAVAARGPGAPVGPVAVDDLHRRDHLDRGWVMAKVPDRSEQALRSALLAGALYASTGPDCDFGVQDGAVVSSADSAGRITVLDALGRVVATTEGRELAYRPRGDERFVRIDVREGSGRAWSNVFWIDGAGTRDQGPGSGEGGRR